MGTTESIRYGSKYNKDLSTKEIAARIRADIKQAVGAGELPKGSYSVRVSHSSTSASIDVRISDVGVLIHSVERVAADHIAKKAGFSAEKVALLDIRPLRGVG